MPSSGNLGAQVQGIITKSAFLLHFDFKIVFTFQSCVLKIGGTDQHFLSCFIAGVPNSWAWPITGPCPNQNWVIHKADECMCAAPLVRMAGTCIPTLAQSSIPLAWSGYVHACPSASPCARLPKWKGWWPLFYCTVLPVCYIVPWCGMMTANITE